MSSPDLAETPLEAVTPATITPKTKARVGHQVSSIHTAPSRMVTQPVTSGRRVPTNSTPTSKHSRGSNILRSESKGRMNTCTKNFIPASASEIYENSPKSNAMYSHIKSRVGSFDNIKHKPGGGNFKPVVKKLDFSNVKPKVGSFDNKDHVPGGSEFKVPHNKLNFRETAKPKVGSLERAHIPSESVKTIHNEKVDFRQNAKPKVDSLANINHVPGGGKNKIESRKLSFGEHAKPKVGSLENVGFVSASERQQTESNERVNAGDLDMLTRGIHSLGLTQEKKGISQADNAAQADKESVVNVTDGTQTDEELSIRNDGSS
eukprot:CFRG4468T1